jgi:hypothetical protein
MTDPRDDRLDNMLRSRAIEPASPDLAQRIIFAARQLPQTRTVSLWQWMRQLCAELHLPKPAYVLASSLVLGMVIGFSLPSGNIPSAADDNTASVQGFFSADEALL